jgi:hypothetical protein
VEGDELRALEEDGLDLGPVHPGGDALHHVFANLLERLCACDGDGLRIVRLLAALATTARHLGDREDRELPSLPSIA